MTWTINFHKDAAKELERLDKSIQKRMLKYVRERLATNEDPRRFGEPLQYHYARLWRYRINDFRLICNIEDNNVTVLVLHVGHRKNVYQWKGSGLEKLLETLEQ